MNPGKARRFTYLCSKSMPGNLIFVSHCDFPGNSAMHLFSIANVLTNLGHSCAVCVPGRPESVLDHGTPSFQVVDYTEALLHGVSFANGQAPDLVHAWTPRELVRQTTMSIARRYNVPYFVHLEDNEMVILLNEQPGWSLENLEQLPNCELDLMVPEHRIHPHHWRRFLAGAAGITVLIDRLLEFKPAHVPGIVFFPGYEVAFAKIDGRDEELRAKLRILPDELVTVYNGSVHSSNFEEVRSLVLAIALVNRRGIRTKLIMTGLNHSALPELSDPEVAQHVIECGFVARSEIPRFVAAADLLIQPGQSNDFNDYRFPAKLPEFLASGKPVILPRSNVGLLLKDGENALILERGDSVDIADAVQRLVADPELAARIGRGGREFALRHLDWAKNIAVLPSFYHQCLARAHLAVQADAVEGRNTPFDIPQFDPVSEDEPLESQDARPHKTDAWFTGGQLASIASTYRCQFRPLPLTYATMRDFGDSLDSLYPLAAATGDLKDSQRPWILKTILSLVRPCSRVLEISGDEPLVADILDRLGYEVWIVDPPCGNARVSLDYERLQNEFPSLRIVRHPFGQQVLPAPPGGFDCIYSISVLEHIPAIYLAPLFAGIKKYLRAGGYSIHAFEHVHKGSGTDEHCTKLKSLVRWAGFEEIELAELIRRMDADPETHYFSAENQGRPRDSSSYEEVRTRVSVSIQMVSRAVHMRVP